MTDHLDDFFAEYRAGLAPEITPAGPGAVRATVRRRRRVAAAAMVATAIVLVAGPVGGYAAYNRGGGTVPEPGTSGTPAPTTPSPETTTPAATTPPPAPPNGRISRSDLLKARVNLPEWAPAAPCAERGADLVDVGDGDGDNLLTTVKYGDVDRDGAQETVAVISCVFLQTGQTQVVAFDRDASGKIITLGRVVATDRIAGSPKPEDIGWIAGIDPRADGTVRVEVGDVHPCCGWEEEWTQRQTRTYTWRDGHFEQTGGAVRFDPNPLFTDLVASVADVKLMINNDGNPYGTIVVVVRNEGELDANLWLSIGIASVEVFQIGPGWDACDESERRTGRSFSFACTVTEPLAAGEERTLRFGIQGAQTGAVSSDGYVSVENRPGGKIFPDQAVEDNSANFKIS